MNSFRVEVRLFARARDLARTDQLALEVTGAVTVGEVRQRLAEACPALANLVKRSAVAVNDEYANDETLLPPGAEVALLPPVSGG